MTIERLDFTKPPPGVTWAPRPDRKPQEPTANAIACAWGHHEAHNDPPGGGYQPGQRVRILPGEALTDALVGREVEVVGDDRGLGRVRVAEVGQAMVHYVLRELVKP